MNSAPAILKWLRAWHRGGKFAVLLIAAWAPFLLPQNPTVTGVIMAIATVLFFLATGPKSATFDSESLTPPEDRHVDP